MSIAASPYKHLEDPFFSSSLDSYEGVPDFVSPIKRRVGLDVSGRAHDALAWGGTVLPGIALSLVLAWAGFTLSELIGRRTGKRRSSNAWGSPR